MEDPQAWKELMETQASYLGKHESDVFKSLTQPNPNEIVETLRSHADQLGVAWYGGTASLDGFVRGSENGIVNFGDHGSFGFSGSMWTSPIFVTGAGGGPWSTVPSDGQEMEFIWWGASVGGGSVNILFKLNDAVIGTMLIVVGGGGFGGGQGNVTWSKLS
jgi:hypothetical protein